MPDHLQEVQDRAEAFRILKDFGFGHSEELGTTREHLSVARCFEILPEVSAERRHLNINAWWEITKLTHGNEAASVVYVTYREGVGEVIGISVRAKEITAGKEAGVGFWRVAGRDVTISEPYVVGLRDFVSNPTPHLPFLAREI